jgi:hypothetical protein
MALGAAVLVGSAAGVGPVASCAEESWPATRLSCEEAEASVSWGDHRIDHLRIWLTTLGAIKSTMNPQQQVIEPALDTPVWLFVYDGRWTCCLHADENGNLVGPTDQSRWILAVDATQEAGVPGPAGTSIGYVYLLEWSGRAVPDRLPRPAAAPSPPLSVALPTLAFDNGACRGIGLDATLAGDPADPRVAWLVGSGGERQELIWPPGFSARFAPDLQVLDASGAIVFRAGDRIQGGCTAGPAGDPGSILVIRPRP